MAALQTIPRIVTGGMHLLRRKSGEMRTEVIGALSVATSSYCLLHDMRNDGKTDAKRAESEMLLRVFVHLLAHILRCLARPLGTEDASHQIMQPPPRT